MLIIKIKTKKIDFEVSTDQSFGNHLDTPSSNKTMLTFITDIIDKIDEKSESH